MHPISPWLVNGLLGLLLAQQTQFYDLYKIVAVIFQQVWKQLDQFPGQDSVRNWLYKQGIKVFWNEFEQNHTSTKENFRTSNLFISPFLKNETSITNNINIQELSDLECLVFFMRYAVALKALEISQVI